MTISARVLGGAAVRVALLRHALRPFIRPHPMTLLRPVVVAQQQRRMLSPFMEPQAMPMMFASFWITFKHKKVWDKIKDNKPATGALLHLLQNLGESAESVQALKEEPYSRRTSEFFVIARAFGVDILPPSSDAQPNDGLNASETRGPSPLNENDFHVLIDEFWELYQRQKRTVEEASEKDKPDVWKKILHDLPFKNLPGKN